MSNNSFGKSKRLINKQEFATVFMANAKDKANSLDYTNTKNINSPAGFRFANAYFSIIAVDLNNSTSRLGIVAAKKSLKHATDRNRFKRLIREYFRLNQVNNEVKLDYVVMARPSFLQIAENKDKVFAEFNNAFNYVVRKYNSSNK